MLLQLNQSHSPGSIFLAHIYGFYLIQAMELTRAKTKLTLFEFQKNFLVRVGLISETPANKSICKSRARQFKIGNVQQSAVVRARQQFSSLVPSFDNTISIGLLYRAGRSMNSPFGNIRTLAVIKNTS